LEKDRENPGGEGRAIFAHGGDIVDQVVGAHNLYPDGVCRLQRWLYLQKICWLPAKVRLRRGFKNAIDKRGRMRMILDKGVFSFIILYEYITI